MRIEGKLTKSGSKWAVEIPLLLVYTQGKTKKDAFAMAKDSVECLIEQKGFAVEVIDGNKGDFSISSNDDKVLMALALKQQRAEHHLTIRDVAKNMGSNSPASYSRYENAQVKPSLEKFSELLCAIDPSLEPILKVS